NLNTYAERDGSNALVRRYVGENAVDFTDLTFDGSLAFKRTITPQRHEVGAEVRFNRNERDSDTGFREQRLTLNGANAGDPLLQDHASNALTTVLSAQLDYTRPFGERTKLETGYKGTLRGLDNVLGISEFDYVLGRWEDDTARSNAFEYDETVHAGYAVLNQGVGKVDLQAGLRTEYTSREFFLENTGETFPKDYWSFFPSALAAINLDAQRQLRLSYSRRIQRPDTRLLNPFGYTEDQRNRFQGNPELEPEYTQSVELAYQHSFPVGSLQVTPYFRRTDNAIRRIRDLRGDTTVTSFRNLATSDSYGADVNASLRMGKVSGFAGVSAFRTVTDAGSLGDSFNSDGIGWSARVNGNVTITPRLDAQAFVMYRAPMDVEQGRIGAMTFSNVSLRQKVMGDKGSISLRVMDPFNRMGFSSRTNDPMYLQLNERRFNGRAAYLTFSYNFGQQPRLRNRPPGEGAEPAGNPEGVGP
ncbi:MAG TPA: outer membrane beta-barrel family protein, partial [Longimicrobium sp.]|nr:outer membrane beta-barrel family protein [Longimicrobium sp.]